jgi:flagellar biosynthetic protein FlhB
MMMAEDSFAEKTEQATPKRRGEARKKGQVAKSREIPSVMVMMAGFSVLYVLSSHIFQELRMVMVRLFNQMGTFYIQPANIQALLGEVLWSFFLILSPILIAVFAVAILSNFVQVGFLFSWESVQPDLMKLNPLKGLSRLFSKQSLVELLKAIFKCLIIGGVAFSTIRNELPQILTLLDQPVDSILRYAALTSFWLFFKAALVIVALAALDYVFQRWSFEKSLRMTKQEIKEEFKQTEGDPLIKSRIRSIQRDLARKRMMAEVPKADVIITNPIHLAVALHYHGQEMKAPKVLAKGAGLIAEKIKEIGRAHKIPIMENKPLAQILYKTIDLGETIPSALYQAVAEILAYVYRLKNKI